MAVVLVPGRPNRTAPVRPRLAARWEDYPGHVVCQGLDLSSYTIPTGSSRPVPGGGPFGPTLKFTAATPNSWQATSLVNGYPAIFVGLMRFADVTTAQGISTIGAIAGSSHRLQVDVFSGTVRFIVVGSGVTAATANVAVGPWYGIVCVASSSTNRKIFVNGAAGTQDTAASTFSDTFTVAFFGGAANSANPNGSAFITAEMALASWFQADMPDAEAMALSAEPLSIFRREPALHYWTIAAGGASNAPRYFHRTMHGMS